MKLGKKDSLLTAIFLSLTFGFFTSAFAAPSDEENIRIVKINDDNFEKEIINSTQPTILEISSTSCPPCLIMIPTLIDIAKNYTDIKVASIGFEDSNIEKIKNTFRIQAFPTFYFLREGKIINMKMGAMKEDELLKALEYTPAKNVKKVTGYKAPKKKNLSCSVDGQFSGLKNHITISFVFGKTQIENVDIVTDVLVPPELEAHKPEMMEKFKASGKSEVTETQTGFKLHTANNSRFMRAMDMKRTSNYGEMKAGLELQGFKCE